MLTATQFADASKPATETLELTFDRREKSRQQAQLRGGDSIGISLRPGTVLQHGAKLEASDGRVIEIVASEESVLQVTAPSTDALARIAYHIGNRHVPLQVVNGALQLLPDHVLRAMIERLGGSVETIEARFTPEPGAYGHSHVHHSHDDMGHGGRIHDFRPRPKVQPMPAPDLS
jgi:urease accessory protein